MEKIAVIGPGTMGCGIGYVAMRSGYKVVFISRTQQSIETGRNRLKRMIDSAVKSGELSEAEGQKNLSKFEFTLNIDFIQSCQLIIEAISENTDSKLQLLKQLSSTASETIISSSTSSIPITELSTALEQPQRFIGMHFFNPVNKIRIVEIVRGEKTSNETFEAASNFIKSLNRIPIAVKDSPGFASSRMICVYINESIRVLEESIASTEEVDSIARLAFGHPLGPLKLADFIGLDVVLDTLNSIFIRTNEERYKPSRLLEQMVKTKKLGIKTGKGFYIYEHRQSDST